MAKAQSQEQSKGGQKVIILQHDPRPFSIDKWTMAAGQKNERNEPVSGEELKIIPGVNIIDADKWKVAFKHPIVQQLVSLGTLEASDGSKPHLFLKRLKPKDAMDVVQKTIDVNILRTWDDNENRVQIKHQIARQLKALAAPPEIRDRSKEPTKSKDDGVFDEGVEVLKPDPTDDAEL